MASRGSVYRRGATWTAHVSWGSGATKRQAKKGGYRTRKEAQAALTELLGSIDAGTFVIPSRLMLRRYLDDWLAGLATAGRRPTTIDRYARMIDAYVSPRIGDVLLQQLSVLDLHRLYATLATEGRQRGGGGLSLRTVRYVHAILS
jgi:Arm DNA-binding domain/Phage integrase, N-terminal SAM-like domain